MKFPIFPLNGAILFPGTNLPLNIFETRYIQMVDYALSNNRLIGMIQTKEDNDFFKIGCIGKITNFTETSGGTYQINLEGLQRFKLNRVIETDFSFITIDAKPLSLKQDLKVNSLSFNKELMLGLKSFLNAKKINFNTAEFEGLDTINLAKIICMICPLDPLIKQMLLEFNSETEFCKGLLSVLEIEMKNTENNLKIN